MYTLLAEYQDFIVINKHCDVSIHNESGEGLIEQLRRDRNSQAVFPVHRLDKATSGLLLCALNSQAASELSQLFQTRAIEKYYLALSEKKPKKKQGLIKGDMAKTRNGSWKLVASNHNPAITQFFSYGFNKGETSTRLFCLKPHTGKSHQLRVALKSIGSPILGDSRYGQSSQQQQSDNPQSDNPQSDNSERMHLHAYCLRFVYCDVEYGFRCLPSGGEFNPEIIKFIEDQLSEPWGLPWPKLGPKLAIKTYHQDVGAKEKIEPDELKLKGKL